MGEADFADTSWGLYFNAAHGRWVLADHQASVYWADEDEGGLRRLTHGFQGFDWQGENFCRIPPSGVCGECGEEFWYATDYLCGACRGH